MIASASVLSRSGEILRLAEEAIRVLDHEDERIRPRDSIGRSGGAVCLNLGLPTLIVPDLHGRNDFFSALLESRCFGSRRVFEYLASGSIQVLCLGDGFHSEQRGAQRWKRAYEEYLGGYREHEAMDQEMEESLSVMERVMACKCEYPEHFHFLKGNHENILNEEDGGNHPFRKIVYEGDMVQSYVRTFFGEVFLRTYSTFEKALPLFAVGKNFLASHAEPRRVYTEEEVIDARSLPEVVHGLTWTNNGEAEEGSVNRMLDRYLEDQSAAFYFGGHRPVRGSHTLRANGRYVQIHNPDRRNAAILYPDRTFDPERDILEI